MAVEPTRELGRKPRGIKLLPCPFCGAKRPYFLTESVFDHTETRLYVRCFGCGAETHGLCVGDPMIDNDHRPIFWGSRLYNRALWGEVARAWNRRVESPTKFPTEAESAGGENQENSR